MKAFPFKRCEATNGGQTLAKALSQFVQSNYKTNPNFTEADFKAIESGLGEIALLRDKAIAVSNKVDRESNPETMVEILQAYYGVLTEFEKRFPFGAFKSSLFSKQTPAVMVEWKWTDAYRSVKISNSHSVKFERAAILFNVGAAFTLCGCTCDRTTEEGIKKSLQYFLKAAGIYQHMHENIAEFGQGQGQDLTAPSFLFLKELVLAQAYACTFESALLKKLLPGTLSVLAAGVSAQYEAVKVFMNPKTPLGEWFTKTPVRWEDHISYQILCFKAASQFWQSKADIKDGKYGVEIARLNLALEITKQSERFESNAPSVIDSRKRLVDAIETRLKEAIKYNDSIYYELVPKASELATIQPKFVGKPIEYTTPPPSYPKIFEKMIPIEVQQAADSYKEQLSKMLDTSSKEANEANDMARVSLSSINLPASLEAVETKSKLPENVKTSLKNIQNAGGYVSLTVVRREIKESCEGCVQLFNKIAEDLDKELNLEKEMRKKYGLKWTRNTSEEVGAEYHKELNMARKFLHQAESADSKVDSSLRNAARSFEIIGYSIAEIEEKIPSADSALKSPESEAVRKQLDILSALLQKRNGLVKKFENALKEIDLANSFMGGQGKNFDKIFGEISKPFYELKSAIDSNIRDQASVLGDVIKANEAFVAKRSSNSALQKKQDLLHELNQAIDLYEKLNKDLYQGKKFYLDLLTNCLNPLQMNVSGFCMARETEATILSQDLESHHDPPPPRFQAAAPSAPDYDFDDYPSFKK